MLKYLSPCAVAKIVLITLKSIHFELTRIAHRFMSRFEKVTCAKVPALHISSWWYSGLLNWSLVHLCKNVSQRLLACFWAVYFPKKCIVSILNQLFSTNVAICEPKVIQVWLLFPCLKLLLFTKTEKQTLETIWDNSNNQWDNLRGKVMDHQNESNNRSRRMIRQCESLRRYSAEH